MQGFGGITLIFISTTPCTAARPFPFAATQQDGAYSPEAFSGQGKAQALSNPLQAVKHFSYYPSLTASPTYPQRLHPGSTDDGTISFF